MKFRILTGRHTEGIGENGAPIIYYGPDRKSGRLGDVVDSVCNLLVLNKEHSIKFDKVPEDTPTTHNGGEPLGKVSKTSVATMEPVDDSLESMTVIALKQLASEEEIEIDATMKKEELISCIRVARDLA